MRHQIWSIVLAAIALAVFSGLGYIFTFRARDVQRLDKIGPISLRPPFKFLRDYVESPRYVLELRIGGIFAFLAAAGVLYSLVRLVIDVIGSQ